MFTNWLTDTSVTGLTNTTARLNETHHPISLNSSSSIPPPTTASSSLSLLNNHNLANIMATPPDIILEVGPGPSSMRFMAHSLVLGMHSGYLRSAIRLDERTAAGGSSGSSGGSSTNADIIVYLTNVTPEQFAPLLTYMYTGYLDLNIENIFGVLLATHVLHMPRALEICRSYLARAQTEGYFGTNNSPLNANNSVQNLGTALSSNGAGKIIRPIASKPQLGNFGFLPINHGPPLPLNAIPTANNTIISNSPLTAHHDKRSSSSMETTPQRDTEEDDIEVDEVVVDKHSLNNENYQSLKIPPGAAIMEDEEDIEVFIDSNSETELVVETEIQKLSFKKLNDNKKCSQEKDTTKTTKTTHHRKSQQQHHHNSKPERRKKTSSGLQVAKAPIPASQLDNSEANKVIIDVASCDGPVRFKRILNTAYGHKPEICGGNSLNNRPAGLVERSLQSVSLSFHQQMAKTISQQQQLQQAEESENSETSNGSTGAAIRSTQDKTSGSSSSNSSSRKIQSEVFVCVYCKHTFKSQYCYQKHAKRHLNPLTLQATCVPDHNKAQEPKQETKAGHHVELQITKHPNINTTPRPYYSRSTAHYLNSTTPVATQGPLHSSSAASSASSTADYLRREVRPLDMNVQYYPCKTCGSKFPSYYFVHKHRKMCHADEEAAQQQNNPTLVGGTADNAINAPTTATNSSNINAEESLNSQNSN